MRQLLILLLLLLTGCGFHLRGSVELPPEMKEINVVDAGGETLIAPDLRDALRDRAVQVVDSAGMTLRVRSESYSRRVLSVDSSGRALEYGLTYKVRVRLQAADGAVWVADELITIQRDLRFDPTAVLASSGEEALLQDEMRREAVQRILRLLSYAKPPEQKAPVQKPSVIKE
ncbi:LPS-assembly lipoprotein LptE [Kaarinaea lacus]